MRFSLSRFMINVATTILLFISLVSARQHTAHQHSLCARGCETEQAFSRDGTIKAQLNKLTISTTATGTFGLDGSRNFELRLGARHHINAPFLGRNGRIFVGMNAGFDTGVSSLDVR